MASDDPRSTDAGLAAWQALLTAHARAVRAIEADLAASGAIPLTWYDVLLELRLAGGGLRMSDLAERVVLSRTRVSRLVGELADHGLLERRPDPDDGRATLAVITRQGRAALRRTAPAYLDGIAQHFSRHLDAEEKAVLAKALRRVAEAPPPSSSPST